MTFNHLHVHSQFSLLDGAADISKMFDKAQQDGMRGLALTDHGNMFGAFNFVAEAWKRKDANGQPIVKPIIGCEFYLVEDRHRKTFTREERDQRYHQLMLAKNDIGYRNLSKICSLGFIEGFYGKYPRIDKELILQYHEGLIATTCCLGAEVPKTILKKGEAEAEKVFKWWLDIFGEDYYVELQRHQIPEQELVNAVLLKFAAKYNVKVIASNDSHYVDQQDANAHDILLCINTGAKKADPTFKEMTDEDGGSPKGSRFAFYNDQFYFKTTAEMSQLFHDLPHALDNTNEIVDKVEALSLTRQILLPNFPVPAGFDSQESYLRHLTFTGAQKRYGDISEEVQTRLEFELFTIEQMGFAGYFLIVADFIQAGRDIGVFIGPGRGSAAGSAVAYCIGITNIDPIKYDLLFERFLNPERKSMPDIDTDFDDEGRQKVIDYVVQKYGRNQVAQIVTYSSMAARMSIKDVARVMDLPLHEANELAKGVPEKPGIKLKRVLTAPIDGPGGLKDKESLTEDDLQGVRKLRDVLNGKTPAAEVLREAMILEGSVRGTGVHAAGIIIAPEDLTNLIPVATAKDSDLYLTQYEGSIIEDAGVIKMDFLGLKTLTIIRDALRMIEANHGVKIDIDHIPLDDAKTFELYQRGETNATFQFESEGMQKCLIGLKPDKLEDLIAVNALYRPGPMDYIPDFVERKHGRKPIVYDLPEMKEYLEETYGITVYQEQVMLLSQKLANFTKGQADTLRKAMGKKQKSVLDDMKSKFMKGCEENGHPVAVCEKIWTDWEAFAAYAFNKSHATCYAFVAYQTAYLKAHYPSEYMAAVLSNNLSNMEKITFFMEEVRRIGLKILGPDVNESGSNFTVNKNGDIRFGLAAIKGVGEGPVEAITEERKARGPFTSPYDFVKRVNIRAVSRRVMENLVLAGAFDWFDKMHRAHYFATEPGQEQPWVDKLCRWGQAAQNAENQSQASLFGAFEPVEIPTPEPPKTEAWSPIYALNREKEVTGFFISGHPFDEFKLEIEKYANTNLRKLSDPQIQEFSTLLAFPGIVTNAQHRMNKQGKPFGTFTLEDQFGAMEIRLFGDDYLKFKHYLADGTFLFIHGQWKKRFANSEESELKISEIKLLQDLSSTVKGLEFTIPVERINTQLAELFLQYIQNHPGELQLKLYLLDEAARFEIPMVSERFKVAYDPHGVKILENGCETKGKLI